MDGVVSSLVDGFECLLLMIVRRALHALDFEKINGAGREWTESFKVVIVRQPIGETRLQ